MTIYVYFWFGTLVYAHFTAARVATGVDGPLLVERNLPSPSAQQNLRAAAPRLIGSNSKFLFLYFPGDATVQIVPLASVSRIPLGRASQSALVPHKGIDNSKK